MADRLFYGTAFAATAVRHWLARVGRQTLRITPGSPWENGSIESLTGMVRDELLDRKRLDTHLGCDGRRETLAAHRYWNSSTQFPGLSTARTENHRVS